MRRINSNGHGIGFVALGLFALACTDDANTGDEVGDTDTGGTDSSSSTSESSTSDSSTEGSDSSTEGDSSTDTGDSSTTDTTDTTTDTTTDATDTTSDTTDTETTGGGDFQLIEATFADDFATLVLTFSDVVGPVDMVEPTDFRISMAWTYSVMYKELYELSYYIDPNLYIGGMETVGMLGISNGPNPDQISLALDPALDPDACGGPANYLADIPLGVTADANLFPHYSPGSTPVTSEGGVELAPIGPDWVLAPVDYTFIVAYHWPNLDPQIPIACP
ncbi:hypothetical protein ACNOYE_26405 [Nannocystaceae bacterium ST9]